MLQVRFEALQLLAKNNYATVVISNQSGIARGIQWLSNINMVLAITLALFVFVVGPTIFILNLLPTSVGSYLAELPMMSARTGAEGSDVDTWLGTWSERSRR